MRIHFLGNICNTHYVLAKTLRQQGVDAHLFLSPADLRHPQALPESEEIALSEVYPSWIHIMPRRSCMHPVWEVPKAFREQVMDCDIVHTNGTLAPYVSGGRVPYVIHPFGGDFFVHPFNLKRWGWYLIHPYFWRLRDRIRKAYKGSSAIIIGTWNPLWERGYRELLNGQKVAAIPLPIDTEKFPFGYKMNDFFQTRFPQYGFYIFQAARQMWVDRDVKGEGGAKGNDILIKGFSILAKEHDDSLLVLVRKGPNIAESEQLIRSLGIQKNVRWVPEVKRFELVTYLQSCDLFVDSLGSTYGSAAIEAMSCGVPTMMAVNEEKYNHILGESPPLINVRPSNSKNIGLRLLYCYQHRNTLKDIARKQHDFVKRHHSSEVVCTQLLNLYEHIIQKKEYPFIGKSAFLK